MDPGGPIMRRRTPHAVIDACRRRDVALGKTEVAVTMRRGDSRHGDNSIQKEFRWFVILRNFVAARIYCGTSQGYPISMFQSTFCRFESHPQVTDSSLCQPS